MRGEVRCPICGHAAGRPGAAAACAECGWKLNTRPRVGPVTEDMRREFDTGLRVAREARAERDEQGLRAALSDLVTAVSPDREGAVIAVGLDGIGLVIISLDAVDAPQVDDGWHLDWADMLPGLPADERGREERLFDGVPGLDGAAVAALVRDHLPLAHGDHMPAVGDHMLVVCRPAGARVLAAAAETIADARPAARVLRVPGLGAAPVRVLAADVAAKDPLRRPYYLLTAHVDASTGDVRPVPRQLFAAGTSPGARARLPLRRMPGDMADVTLAVFAGNGRSDWSRARALALYQVPLPGDPDPDILVVLDGPGRVSVARPPRAVSHPDTWPRVFGRIPARVTATARSPVDLACAVDLSGTAEAVRQRKTLAHDLIQLASHEYPGRRLRVAVVTCTDHEFGRQRGGEYRQIIDSSGLGPAASALEWLAAAEHASVAHRWCAPVEDLLDAASALLVGSVRAGRRPRLLTLAGRPPHPFPQRQGRNACPRGIDWERVVVPKLDRIEARRAVVVDELPPARSQERADWSRIGPAGQHSIATATASRLADELGLLIPRSQRVPLPLTDDREGGELLCRTSQMRPMRPPSRPSHVLACGEPPRAVRPRSSRRSSSQPDGLSRTTCVSGVTIAIPPTS